MENVEKAISRIMADKVYTSAEFKRERDNFHALCKDLEREEIKRWLKQILEILMAERSKEERGDQNKKLEGLLLSTKNLFPPSLPHKSRSTCTGSATPTVMSSSHTLSSWTPSCSAPPAKLLPAVSRTLMSSLSVKRRLLPNSRPKEPLSMTSSQRESSFWRTQTSQSSWKDTSRGLSMAGTTPRKRHRLGLSSSITPRTLGLVMPRAWKPLQLNSRREMMKSRRLRNASTCKLPLKTSRRDRRSSMRQRTLLKACTTPSRTTMMS